LTEFALARLLPVAPRPETDERLSSWLARLAAIYGSPVGALLAHCGVAGADPFVLEKGLGAGEGALLAERTGLSPEKIEAMTFREVAAPARFMIARGDRGICPRCAETPAIRRRDAALPWGFWCAVHGRRRRPLGGEAIETLFGAAALTKLDPFAQRGARRLADWTGGRDDATPSVPDLLAFVTAPHRRPSPPQLHEQPRLSLEARRAYRDFLEFPIARQALLAVVPEYDRIAPASLNNSGASLISPDSTCLRNSDSESHKPCSEPRAKALSLSHSGRTTHGVQAPLGLGAYQRSFSGLSGGHFVCFPI
jgi:TniQ